MGEWNALTTSPIIMALMEKICSPPKWKTLVEEQEGYCCNVKIVGNLVVTLSVP